jgi:hypothetical protein
MDRSRVSRRERWQPTPEELVRILDEMRPIVADFARRAESFLATAALSA